MKRRFPGIPKFLKYRFDSLLKKRSGCGDPELAAAMALANDVLGNKNKDEKEAARVVVSRWKIDPTDTDWIQSYNYKGDEHEEEEGPATEVQHSIDDTDKGSEGQAGSIGGVKTEVDVGRAEGAVGTAAGDNLKSAFKAASKIPIREERECVLSELRIALALAQGPKKQR